MIEIQYNSIFKKSPLSSLVLIPDAPRFTIAAVNEAYLTLTNTREANLVGKGFFEVFPETHQDASVDMVSGLRHSLHHVITKGKWQKMPTQNYAFSAAGTGRVEIRYREIDNIPVFTKRNEMCHILHTVQDRIEKQMSALVNDAEIFFVLLDKELHIVSFNKQFQELYKEYFTREVQQLDSILDYYPPESKEKTAETFSRVLAGSSEELELFFTAGDHKMKHFVTKYSPAKDERGVVIGVFVTGTDVTKEMDLKRSQEVMINNTADLIWSTNNEFKLIASNDAFLQSIKNATGVTLQPLDDLLISGVFPDDYLAFWRACYEKVLSGESFKKEIYVPPFNTQQGYWSEISFNPIYGTNDIIGITCYSRDITERKNGELKVTKEKNLSDAIIKNLPGIFCLIDKNKKFLRWNENFEKVTKYNIAEIEGMNVIDFFQDADKELVSQKISEVFTAGEGNFRAGFRSKTNEKTAYYFTWIAIEYEGNPCLSGVCIDLSESVDAQERIKQITDQSRQLAIHLQNVKEEERKRIGHEIHDELGQQLTAIHLDVAWIDKQIPNEATLVKRKLKNIVQLLEGSNQSIRRILSELRPRILDDHGLLDAILWLGNKFTENTGIPVMLTTGKSEIKSTEVAAICIFRVCQEALTNITRYAHASKVSISLGFKGDAIVFVIEDDGIGFDAEFVQNKKSFGLLGMKARVLSLGGKYDLVTAPSKGTKIAVELPGNILN